jgi:hypothetical protein
MYIMHQHYLYIYILAYYLYKYANERVITAVFSAAAYHCTHTHTHRERERERERATLEEEQQRSTKHERVRNCRVEVTHRGLVSYLSHVTVHQRVSVPGPVTGWPVVVSLSAPCAWSPKESSPASV